MERGGALSRSLYDLVRAHFILVLILVLHFSLARCPILCAPAGILNGAEETSVLSSSWVPCVLPSLFSDLVFPTGGREQKTLVMQIPQTRALS